MEKYEFLSRTGEGAYGSVWRARDKNTGLMVAVKKMKDVPTNEEEGEIAMREVRVLQLAKHVNVVNLLEAYKSQSGRLYLVFEFVERTLLQELKVSHGGMAHAAVKSITWQLLQALGYLHRKQIIHRDVKPSNILITDSGVVKICDFGFARACANTSNDPAYTTYVVTRWYRPPEVLVGDTYGPPVDIWALGCIFAEMLAGRPLFPGKNHHDQLWLILKCVGRMTERQLTLLDSDPQFECFRLPTQSEVEPLDQRLSSVPPAAMQVLRACLDPDPSQRASAEELLAMPYFQGVTEVLPLEDLGAYPCVDMRARLDRTLAQDQATAAAAVAREAVISGSGGGGGRRVLVPAGKPQGSSLTTAGSVSPPRLALQQLPQPQQSSGLILPAKAATSSKLEPHVEVPRPPLQRHITAPAGSIAHRVHAAGQTLQPLLMEVYSHQQTQVPQRSRSGSDSSQQNSPRVQSTEDRGLAAGLGQTATVLQPVRSRPTWRLSGDGPGDLPGPLQPCARQALSAGLGLAPVPCVPGGTVDPLIRFPLDSSSGSSGRPPQQRTTWNGCVTRNIGSANSVGAGSAGAGGASSGGAGLGMPAGCGLPPGPYSLASYGYKPSPAVEAAAMHRKAHSLAGNEGLPPATGGGMGLRGAGSGITGVQGRSLAPTLGHGTSGTSAGCTSVPMAVGIPAPQPHGLPTTAIIHRLNPSPPPGSYSSSLRNGNVMGPVPGGPPGRTSHDSSGATCVVGPQGVLKPSLGVGQPTYQQHGANGGSVGGPVINDAQSVLLDIEASESCVSESGAAHNDGRRASDTVLYAAAALREAKYRIDKATHIIAMPNRPQITLLESTAAPASLNTGAVGTVGAIPLRTPSFTRTSALSANGPPSPDHNHIHPAAANLPPLQGTPQRRYSTSDGTSAALLLPTYSVGPGTIGGGGSSNGRGGSAASQPNSGNGFGQRHPPKQTFPNQVQGQWKATGGLPQTISVDTVDLGDCSNGAHAFLPLLEVGNSAKSARGGSAATSTALAIVRRPSKGSVRLGPDSNCKREEAAKSLLLEAVPEASVL